MLGFERRNRRHSVAVDAGAMLQQFDFCQKRVGFRDWTSRHVGSRSAGNPKSSVDPQFSCRGNDAGARLNSAYSKQRSYFDEIAGNTDTRTMIASVVARMPCGQGTASCTLDSASVIADLGVASQWLEFICGRRVSSAPRIARTHVDYHYAREVAASRTSRNWRSIRPSCGLESRTWSQSLRRQRHAESGDGLRRHPGANSGPRGERCWFSSDHAAFVRASLWVDAVIPPVCWD